VVSGCHYLCSPYLLQRKYLKISMRLVSDSGRPTTRPVFDPSKKKQVTCLDGNSTTSILAVVDLSNIRQQLPIKDVTPNRHLKLIEGVFHDVVSIHIIYAADYQIDVGLRGIGENQELRSRHGVETL
jgi:hypothetical protein